MKKDQPTINIYIENLYIQKESKQEQNVNSKQEQTWNGHICTVVLPIGQLWTQVKHTLDRKFVHVQSSPSRQLEIQYPSINELRIRKPLTSVYGFVEMLELRITK